MKTLWSCLILSLVILAFFSRFLSGHYLFFAADEASSDLLDFNYPQRVYLAQHLKNNQIPLWTPYQSNGFPFLAEAQTGVFYPVNLLLFRFLPVPLAFNWSIIASFIILSWGTFFYLRSLGLKGTSAFFSALILPFTGFFISHLKHVQLLQSVVFLPWLLLWTEKIISKPIIKYTILLSFTFAFSILAGHLPASYSIALFVFFYFLIRLAQISKQHESLKPVILLAIGFILGLGLSSAQIIPTLEMIPESTRTHFSQIPAVPLPLDHLLTFINPFIFGDPSRGNYQSNRPSFWESLGYFGLIPLFLAFLGIFLRQNKLKAGKILLGISFLFILGIPHSIFNFLWSAIPGLSFSRLPSRFLLFADFFFLAIAGFGIEKFLVKFSLRKKESVYFIIVILSLADLWLNFSSYYSAIPANLIDSPAKITQFLKKDPDYFRITTLNQGLLYNQIYQKAQGWRENQDVYLNAKELLLATGNSLWQIKSIHFPNEYFGSFSLGKRSELSSLTQGAFIFDPLGSKLLGLQNVKYVLSSLPFPSEATASYKLAYSAPLGSNLGDVFVYQNLKFLPRAYLTTKSKVMPSPEILTAMAVSPTDQDQVILEKPSFLPRQPVLKIAPKIKFLKDQETFVSLEVSAPTPVYLVLTDTYYPGWQALVDGKPTEILQANYAFRALPLGAGRHLVNFTYKPMSFYLGAFISFMTLIFIIIMAIVTSQSKNFPLLKYPNRKIRMIGRRLRANKQSVHHAY